MDENTIVIEQKPVKNKENKICSILYTIAAVCWIICLSIEIYSISSGYKKMGITFWLDIVCVIIFSAEAVIYTVKYAKEKKAEKTED